MKIDRLISIIVILLDKEKVTAKSLAKKFGVSTKTIYRDVSILSEANVPIYCDRGVNGGICLHKNYQLNTQFAGKSNLEDILKGISKFQAYSHENIAIKKSLAHQENDWLEIDFSSRDSKEMEKEYFQKVRNAILNRKVVDINYCNEEDKLTTIRIEPLKIVVKSDDLYVQGYCLLSEESCELRFSSLRSVSILERTSKDNVKEVIENFIQEFNN